MKRTCSLCGSTCYEAFAFKEATCINHADDTADNQHNNGQNQNKDQNQDQNQNNDQNHDQNQGDQPKPQQGEGQGDAKISPQQAQQMLKAVQAREKETQDKVNKEKAALLKARQKEKNW